MIAAGLILSVVAIAEALVILSDAQHAPGVCTVFHAVALAALLALVFVKDLGKSRSLILCAVLLAAKLVDVTLAILYCILTSAKYLDKAERGRK